MVQMPHTRFRTKSDLENTLSMSYLQDFYTKEAASLLSNLPLLSGAINCPASNG